MTKKVPNRGPSPSKNKVLDEKQKMTKKVPKRAPSPAKNEVLDEKPKIVLHMGILVFMG